MAITHNGLKDAVATLTEGSTGSFTIDDICQILNCSRTELMSYLSTQGTSFGLVFTPRNNNTRIEPLNVIVLGKEDEDIEELTEIVEDISSEIYDEEDGILFNIATAQSQIGNYNPVETDSTITEDIAQMQEDITSIQSNEQTAIDGEPIEPVASDGSIIIDEGVSIDFEAKLAGISGNSIKIDVFIPETTLVLSLPVAGLESSITYTGIKGVNPISIIYSGGTSQDFSITNVANAITVQLKTDETNAVKTTAAVLLTALQLAISGGSVEDDIADLSAVFESAEITDETEWNDGSTIIEAMANPDYLDSIADVFVDMEESLIEVHLPYNGETDTILSTIDDVKNYIEADENANDLVAVLLTGLDSNIMTEDEVTLTGGVDGTPGKGGQLRYGASAYYVSAGISTISESKWKTIPYA